tara:strand:+ start:226 stop:510 length:285 start_codon:yes stop_codon:yes gene_type:complete
MNSQLPPNPETNQNQITPEQLEQMKLFAKQQAIQQVLNKRPNEMKEKIIYVRRNLTVAELILIFIISSGILFGIQTGWNFVSNVLPKIEIKVNQ